MAHVVSITDGTTTITFTAANGYQVEEYDPRTPEAENGDVDSIAETLQIYITGSSGGQVQTRQAALERLLLRVRDRAKSGVGPRVFLQLQLDSDASTWRSELFAWALPPREQALRLWPNNVVSLELSILRAPWWEGALAQLPLTNGNGSNNTSGLTGEECRLGSPSTTTPTAPPATTTMCRLLRPMWAARCRRRSKSS